MVRPPQFDRSRFPEDDPPADFAAVKATVKRMDEPGRELLMRWLLTYYEDDGKMRSPQINRRRQCIALDGIEYWLVRVPKRRER